RCKTNNFAYTDKEFYGSADIYYLTGKTSDINLFYLLGYLNSKAFFYWFNYIGKKKGKNLEFYSTPLKESPIYYPEDKKELLYVEGLVKQQLKEYKEEVQKEIDNYFDKKLEINLKEELY
ncbi:MAG: TaqI-like C-terminal specificity domain-containing protein, partial [Cetobacterium sp.]